MPDFSNAVKGYSVAAAFGVPDTLSSVRTSEHPAIKTFLSLRKNSGSATTGLFGHNSRKAEFSAVRDAILLMTKFVPGHPLYLEEAAAWDAVTLLDVIEDNLNIEAPKIFPQDDETLVMKWARGQVERLLSITKEDLAILEHHAGSRMRCLYEDQHEAGFDLGVLFPSMGNAFTTSTQTGGENA